jgi:hypothetical protein
VATSLPGSYAVSGSLPAGLTLNTTGQISGTLQEAGVFNLTLNATNAGGTGTLDLTITSLPAVSSQSSTVPLGQPLSVQFVSSEQGGTGVTYSATGLPVGIAINPTSGLITGSTSQAGIFAAAVSVSKAGASAAATFTLTVSASPLNAWRLANFSTTTNSGNAADGSDPDKDGKTNIEEYAAGTNPNDKTDYLKILTTSKSATMFLTTVAGKASRTYALERRSSLTSGSWTAVDTRGPLSVPATVNLIDMSPPAQKAFYRIQVSAP